MITKMTKTVSYRLNNLMVCFQREKIILAVNIQGSHGLSYEVRI